MTFSASVVIASACVLVGLFQASAGQRQLCGRVLADTLDLVCAERGFHLGKRNGRSVGMVYAKSRNQPVLTNSKSSSRSGSRMLPTGTKTLEDKDNKDRSKTEVKTMDVNSKSIGGVVVSPKRVRNSKLPVPVLYNLLRNDDRIDATSRHRRQAQSYSIVDECCLQACTFSTLESYCAAPDDPDELMSLNDLRVRLGFNLRGPTSRPHQQTPSNQEANAFNHPSAQINRGQSSDQSNPFFYLSLGQQATRSPLLQKRQP